MLRSSFVSSIVTDGLLDTNLFIHAHLDDAHSGECRRFLEALRRGSNGPGLKFLWYMRSVMSSLAWSINSIANGWLGT